MKITRPFVDDVMVKKYISDQRIEFFVGPFNYPVFFFRKRIDEKWVILAKLAYLTSVSSVNCNPLSVMISFGVLNLQECFLRADTDVDRVEQLDVSAKGVDYDDCTRETHVCLEWQYSSLFVSWVIPQTEQTGCFYNRVKRNHCLRSGATFYEVSHILKNVGHKSLELSSG